MRAPLPGRGQPRLAQWERAVVAKAPETRADRHRQWVAPPRRASFKQQASVWLYPQSYPAHKGPLLLFLPYNGFWGRARDWRAWAGI